MNPGDTRLRHSRGPPLNEGRDVNPGDTRRPREDAADDPSTASALNEGRDVNPGDTTRQGAAQRNEGRDVNPGDTRAGLDRRAALGSGPLNEGRDVNPGDTGREALHGYGPAQWPRSTKAGT